MQSRSSTPSREGRTSISLLALTCCLLVAGAALVPTLAFAGTTTNLANDGGNTSTDDTTTGPTEVTECRTIDESGDYRLGNDLTATTDDCLVVTTGGVSIDGAGFTVTGPGRESGAAVKIAPSTDGAGNVAVRDLTVRQGSAGVVFQAVDDVTVSGVTATDSTFGVQFDGVSGATLTDSRATDNEVGVEARSSADVTLDGVVVNGSTAPGVSSFRGTTGLRVVDSRIVDNAGSGVLLTGGGQATVLRVNASDNGPSGVDIASPDATVRRVNAGSNDDHGIDIRAPGATVENVTASDNGEHGVLLSVLSGDRDDRRVIGGNGTVRVHDNGGDGVRVAAGSGVTISGVEATGNRDGINLTRADAIEVAEFTASSNDRHGVALVDTTGSTVRAGTVLDNSEDGFRLRNASGNSLRELFVGNNTWSYRATGNGRNGVVAMDLRLERETDIRVTTISFDANDVRLRLRATPDTSPGPGNRTFAGTLRVNATETPDPITDPAGANVSFADLTVSYESEDLKDPRLREESARIHVFDGSIWSEVPGSSVDTGANEVSANLTNPAGAYAPVADLKHAIVDCGDDPDEAGTWRVVDDISTDNDTCITVEVDDVVVEGEFNTITGSQAAGSEGVVFPAGVDNVTVRNLTVRDWETGVAVRNVDGTLENVRLRSNTGTGVLVDRATGAVLDPVLATDTGVSGGGIGTTPTEGNGIEVVDSDTTRIGGRTKINGSTGDGILLDGAVDTELDGVVLAANDDYDIRETGGTTGTLAADINLFDPTDGEDPPVTVADFTNSQALRLAAVDDPEPAGSGLEPIDEYVNASGSASDATADLVVTYNGSRVGREDDLGLYRYDADAGEYVAITGDPVQPDDDQATFTLTEFGEYGLFVDTTTPTPTNSPTGSPGTTTSPGDDRPTDTPTDDPDDTDDDSGDDGTTEFGGDSGDDGGSGGGGGGGGDTTGSPSFRTVEASVNRTEMRAGETLAVRAVVENTGDGFGRYEPKLYRNGRFARSRFVDLSPGERETIVFEREPGSAGNYTYRVENRTAGTVEVAPPPDTPTPTPGTPTPGTPTDGTPTDGTSTPGTPTDGTQSTPATDGGTPTTSGTPGSPTDGTPTSSPSPTMAPTPTNGGPGGGSPTSTGGGGGFGGIGPVGIAAGGVGAVAIGGGVAYYLLTRPV